MEGTIVLYPVMAMGHLVSMLELAELILRQYHLRFSVTVIIATCPFVTPNVTAFLRCRASQANPSITFHHLPSLTVPFSIEPSPNRSLSAIFGEIIRLNNLNIFHALQTISKSSTIRALVMDFLCASASSVASDLGIHTYYYIPAGAIALSFFLYLPTMHNQTTKSFKDLTMTHLHLPGLPPIPASHMPQPVLNREDQSYHYMLEIGSSLPKSKGIIVNTFESLESRVTKAITDGLCIPDAPTPPVYCIGPLIDSPTNHTVEGESVNQCLSWLDAQPSQSVVFLCFGSRGVFPTAQVKEIAVGLEKSGQRFLWSLRKPISEDNTKHSSMEQGDADSDLDGLLPEGFLGRTKDRGFIVKSWAPQVEVLNRESVGGFLTHCGWNSVLEAVCAGVPMVAWPLYAEQRMNRAVLVEEMKLAMPMEESEDGLVCATEIEKRVRALMESEEGRIIRERSRKMKEEAMAAWSEGGSSKIAVAQLANSWINRCQLG